MQTNYRPAANREHKKLYREITFPIVDHTMVLNFTYACILVHAIHLYHDVLLL